MILTYFLTAIGFLVIVVLFGIFGLGALIYSNYVIAYAIIGGIAVLVCSARDKKGNKAGK